MFKAQLIFSVRFKWSLETTHAAFGVSKAARACGRLIQNDMFAAAVKKNRWLVPLTPTPVS